ncbi:hypothetical protein GCM10020366_28380 [Saccharopolyspora gregorii]|uniref:Uncharacterized protein n=1 Tax=Saccharopolyspora gregorii TaxID=33914 RepID=A0ABP6RLB3_9PSEU
MHRRAASESATAVADRSARPALRCGYESPGISSRLPAAGTGPAAECRAPTPPSEVGHVRPGEPGAVADASEGVPPSDGNGPPQDRKAAPGDISDTSDDAQNLP